MNVHPCRDQWLISKWKFYATEGPQPLSADRAFFHKSATGRYSVCTQVLIVRTNCHRSNQSITIALTYTLMLTPAASRLFCSM